ncbi:MAG: hypothetical protein KAJ79_00815 [Candidatus Omnitrophica bacterium]|nr:hypothetical protein [Candidatus Omnitrophota bacterium]
MKKKKLILYFFYVFSFSVIFPVQAQLTLDKGKISKEVVPGESVSGVITVINSSNVNYRLKAYFQDFEYIPPFDGTKKFLPIGSSKYSCGEWVVFSPQDLVVPPKTKKVINYTVSTPRDISGGYNGVLFMETIPDDATGQFLKIVTRTGCLFFIETVGSDKKGKIDNIVAEGNKINFNLINTGNIILMPEATFYIMSEEGMVVDRGKIKKCYLPPEGKFPFVIQLKDDLSGKYSMILTYDLMDNDLLVKEIDFSKQSSGQINILDVRD